MKIKLKKLISITNSSWGEEYEAYIDGGTQVGHIFTMNGCMGVSCPDKFSDVEVLDYEYDDDYRGSHTFRCDAERVGCLNKAVKAIEEWVEKVGYGEEPLYEMIEDQDD